MDYDVLSKNIYEITKIFKRFEDDKKVLNNIQLLKVELIDNKQEIIRNILLLQVSTHIKKSIIEFKHILDQETFSKLISKLDSEDQLDFIKLYGEKDK